MQTKMTFIDENGSKIECSVVAMFKNGNHKYVAYTDDKEIDFQKDLLVSRYTLDGEEPHLMPIEDETEWEFINDYLNREIFEEDGEFDD